MSGTDVLSQSEIDQLLSALSTGVVSTEELKEEQEHKKVKVYDFKRPDKFSKDQIRTLSMLHENFARLLNTYLSTQLRTLINVTVASVDQLTYEEFVISLSNPSVIGVLTMRPLKGNVIFEINSNIAFAIIDRLFGGIGEVGVKIRALTDIEEAVMRKVMGKALESLREAWGNVLDIDPNLEAMETNPQFAQIVPPSDMVVLVTLKIKVGNVEGLMNICIPYLVLEPIMSKLTTTYWVASTISREEHPEQVEVLQRKIEKTYIPLTVELGRIDVTVSDFLDLSVGDVLQFDTKVNDDLNIIVGKKPKFMCRPGISGKKLAVQVTRIKTEGEDNDE